MTTNQQSQHEQHVNTKRLRLNIATTTQANYNSTHNHKQLTKHAKETLQNSSNNKQQQTQAQRMCIQ